MSPAKKIATSQVPAIVLPAPPLLDTPNRMFANARVSQRKQERENAIGERACRRLWEFIRGLPPSFLLGVPIARQDADCPERELILASGDAMVPYHAIARETERALAQHIDSASASALVLLAALALCKYEGGTVALQLSETARQLGARAARAQVSAAQILHAALIAPLCGSLDQAATMLNKPGHHDLDGCLSTLCLAGTAFAAGTPLADLSRHLERARGLTAMQGYAGAAGELAARAALVHSLMLPQALSRPPEAPAGGTHYRRPVSRFGYWLAQLQAAWYAGKPVSALQAARRAASLAGPLTPAADQMCYHLFTALALVSARHTAAFDGLRRHSKALRLLAERSPAGGGAMAELADALLERHAGAPLTALRGFERAAIDATGRCQHWLAALAAEQAAEQAYDLGLASAARHYRSQALGSYARWGALGRIEVLRRAWDEPGLAVAGDSLDEADRLQRADTIGDLGMSIAHEVNQPLAAIALHTAAASKWLRRAQPDIERALASLSLIGAAGRQANEIVRSVHQLAARQDNEMGDVTVDDAVTEAVQLLRRTMRKHGVEAELALGLGACVIRANRVQLQQVVTNLIVNAIEALASAGAGPGQRRIAVRSRRYNEDEVEISVADNGPGIAIENRECVFARLFSTKPNSTGMGLCISRSIAWAHGGELVFEPREPHGSCFLLRLPLQAVEAGGDSGAGSTVSTPVRLRIPCID
jgi:signal transduction histidine kinase